MLCLFLGGWRMLKRYFLRKLIASGLKNIDILMIGTGDTSKILLKELERQPYLGFNVIGCLSNSDEDSINVVPILGSISDFASIVKKYFIEKIIITISTEEKKILELITQARKMGLEIMVVPEKYGGEFAPIVDVNYLGVIPLITFKERKLYAANASLKKVFDFFASLTLLILLSPIFLITAILVKINSPGPVFFVQKRIGLRAKPFNLYKFRSMVQNADVFKESLLETNDVKGGVVFKMKEDPRITKTGKFLRKYSLDELPQIFNVLKGDMSLVGPRPSLPDEMAQYADGYMGRLAIKPGITGLSQIRGRSDLSFSRWVKWDLWYIDNWSFGLDLKILFLTIPEVINARGAY